MLEKLRHTQSPLKFLTITPHNEMQCSQVGQPCITDSAEPFPTFPDTPADFHHVTSSPSHFLPIFHFPSLLHTAPLHTHTASNSPQLHSTLKTTIPSRSVQVL